MRPKQYGHILFVWIKESLTFSAFISSPSRPWVALVEPSGYLRVLQSVSPQKAVDRSADVSPDGNSIISYPFVFVPESAVSHVSPLTPLR